MHDPRKEELYEIKGNAPDPLGSNNMGLESSMDLTRSALAHAPIRYQDRVSEADVYEREGKLLVHLYCPRCTQALHINSEHKRVELSGTRISIAPFRCTWPSCGLHVRVENNKAIEM